MRRRRSRPSPRPPATKSGWPAALCRCVAIAFVPLLLGACVGNLHMSFLDPQGPVANTQRFHFYWVVVIMAVLVAAPIFLLTPFWAWRYRYGAKTRRRYTPKWNFSRVLEVMSWGGPIVIVGILAFFVWRDSHRLDPYKPLASNQPALRVQIIGYDWKWLIIYPDQGIASIGMLAMPVGRPLAMHLTSATVMQSFFIPALGSQIYAMGGMDTQLHLEANRPGRSLGENTMYNGDGFHQQKFTAVAMPPADFKAWVRKVRAHGIPLDAQTLSAISKRATRSDLIAALPKAASMGGDVYFNDVSKSLYAAVVKATRDGTPIHLAAARADTGNPVGATGKSSTPATERQP
ncbi:MAG: ubiquinol oxidase subunit II [Rhodanobacteraceae bacterium]